MRNHKRLGPDRIRFWVRVKNILFLLMIVLLVIEIAVTIGFRKDALAGSAGEQQGRWFPFHLMEVTSDSMYPVFRTGDGLVIKEVPFDRLQKGDVISFYQNGQMITHEIIEVGDHQVVTQGRNNALPDLPVNEENYLGRMILVLPRAGVFFQLISGIGGKVIMAAIIFILFFGPPIGMWLTEKRT